MRWLTVILCTACSYALQAQQQPPARYEIRDGVMREVSVNNMRADSSQNDMAEVGDTLSKRELRRLERDTMRRYTWLFRDTVPLSRMTAISFVAPGFSQFHNRQAWKVPILWGTVGTALYYGLQQNKCYQKAKSHYDELIYYGYERSQSDLDETQRIMIKYNTRRQLLFGAAAAAYFYFIGDGVMNYPGGSTNVKIATTLSTICPGAGQIYNRSYWKAPIVMGSFATMAMMIDWNNRGYKRFQLAYDLKMAGRNDAVEPGLQSRPATEMLEYRKAYRRNRDLCIILTGAVYLINLVDAHVDAHMETFDVDDKIDLAFMPTLTNVTTSRGSGNAIGMGLNLRF